MLLALKILRQMSWTRPFGVLHTLPFIRGNKTKHFAAFQI